MSSCVCPPENLTSVSFGDGVVMRRCRVHEVQMWTVDGRPTSSEAVLPALKDMFVDQRGASRTRGAVRPARPAARRPAVIRLDAPVEQPAADAGAQLTALLRARGLQGSWTIA